MIEKIATIRGTQSSTSETPKNTVGGTPEPTQLSPTSLRTWRDRLDEGEVEID